MVQTGLTYGILPLNRDHGRLSQHQTVMLDDVIVEIENEIGATLGAAYSNSFKVVGVNINQKTFSHNIAKFYHQIKIK